MIASGGWGRLLMDGVRAARVIRAVQLNDSAEGRGPLSSVALARLLFLCAVASLELTGRQLWPMLRVWQPW